MRKFSFLALVASLFVVQSFAQPRDLFAEFEAEAEASQSSEAVVTAPSSSSVPAPASSASVSSSSAKPATPASSASVSSSSAPVLSSSSAVSSSSVASVASSSSVAPVSSSAEVSSSSAMSSSSVAVADTLVQDSSTVADTAVAPADSAAPVPADSVAPVDSLKADSAVVASVSSSSVVAAAPSSSSMSRRELLGPVKVSKVNGIDEMKGKYKSPRKALFMSLVIPGSGQMYVGGSKFTYARGAVYLALEAALWSGWYYYSVYKYDKQVNRYKKYAKQHYSIGAYENEMRTIYNTYASAYEDEFSTRYLGSRESFCEGIFGTATIHGCYNKDQLYHDDIEYEKDFVKNPKSLGEEMESIKFDSPSEIYQLIADDTYVLGWDDVDAVTPSSLNLQDPNSETVSLGTSSHQKEYRSMRSKANDYADMQAWFFGGLILNHIISAVDAAFTANSHNKALYEEDLSWYDHLHFDSGFSFADGLGVNVQASWGF